MRQHEARPGVAHDSSNLLSAFCAIAMNGTGFARRLLNAKGAAFDASIDIFGKLETFGAKSFPPTTFAQRLFMMAPAVHRNHDVDGLALARDSFFGSRNPALSFRIHTAIMPEGTGLTQRPPRIFGECARVCASTVRR